LRTSWSGSLETKEIERPLQVRVSITWEVIVDGQVDTLDINTTTEDVSGDTDTLVEFLEFLVALDTIEESA